MGWKCRTPAHTNTCELSLSESHGGYVPRIPLVSPMWGDLGLLLGKEVGAPVPLSLWCRWHSIRRLARLLVRRRRLWVFGTLGVASAAVVFWCNGATGSCIAVTCLCADSRLDLGFYGFGSATPVFAGVTVHGSLRVVEEFWFLNIYEYFSFLTLFAFVSGVFDLVVFLKRNFWKIVCPCCF